MSIRSRTLNKCFNLLYGPLVFLHEPAGMCLFGPSWAGRRRSLLQLHGANGLLLDVGCGAGQLIEHARQHGRRALGIDPSTRMLRRAGHRNVPVLRARAEALPLAGDTVASVVASYPGPWISDPMVWLELSRVLKPGGRISILLGGTVERGRGAAVRSRVTGIMYGAVLPERIAFDPPLPDSGELSGALFIEEDEWGTSFYWRGEKRGS